MIRVRVCKVFPIGVRVIKAALKIKLFMPSGGSTLLTTN